MTRYRDLPRPAAVTALDAGRQERLVTAEAAVPVEKIVVKEVRAPPRRAAPRRAGARLWGCWRCGRVGGEARGGARR